MSVREDIEEFADEDDKKILHWLLDRYHWSSQWNFVAKCYFKRYGKRSYESNRVWQPTQEGRIIYEYLTTVET